MQREAGPPTSQAAPPLPSRGPPPQAFLTPRKVASPSPHTGKHFLLPLDGSSRAKKPSPSSPLQSLPEPHPGDRCVQGTLDEPPGAPRGLQPPPTWQLLEGFRFPEAEPLPTASSWRQSLCWPYSCALGLGASWRRGGDQTRDLWAGLCREGPAWPWLSAVTTVSPLWGPAATWSTLCWARPSGSLPDRVSTRLAPEVWSPRGCPGLRQHCCTCIPGEHSRA